MDKYNKKSLPVEADGVHAPFAQTFPNFTKYRAKLVHKGHLKFQVATEFQAGLFETKLPILKQHLIWKLRLDFSFGW